MSSRRNDKDLVDPVDDPDKYMREQRKKAKEAAAEKDKKSVKNEVSDGDGSSSLSEVGNDRPDPAQAKKQGDTDKNKKDKEGNDQPDRAQADKKDDSEKGGDTKKTADDDTRSVHSQQSGQDGVDKTPENDQDSPLAGKTGSKQPRRNSNDSALFVSEGQADSESEREDPEYGRPLFSRPRPKVGDKIETIGWGTKRNSIFYLNRYGPKNAARYRLERSADTPEYERAVSDNEKQEYKISSTHNRYGELKNKYDKFVYTKRHIEDFWGVAWAGAKTGNIEDDLDLIDPKEAETWTDTYILVEWNLEGRVGGPTEKKWETRQSIRLRCGKEEGDDWVFNAALDGEDRHQQHLEGKLRATSRSPSVGLVPEITERFRKMSPPLRTKKTLTRAKSRAADSGSDSGTEVTKKPRSRRKMSPRTQRTSRRSKSRSADPGISDLAERLEEFKIDFCELYDVSDFEDLDSVGKAECVKAWRHAKDNM